MGTPQVNFKDYDFTDQPAIPVDGITFVMGTSKRGPLNDPKDIISSWPRFVKEYGGLTSNTDTLLVKRLLDKGGKIRFARLTKYTNIEDRASYEDKLAEPDDDFLNSDDMELFELVMKNPGADYNNVKAIVTAASNGSNNYFNLYITHALEPDLNESYINLSIPISATAENQSFLKNVTISSLFVDVVYKDLTTVTDKSKLLPIPTTINFELGEDRSNVLAASDYVGSSVSNLGLNAFDAYDDSYQLVALGILPSENTSIMVAGNEYATNRKDLMYWTFLSNDFNTKESLITLRQSTAINNEFSAFFAGGLKVNNPLTSMVINLNAITDIAALAAINDTKNGPYSSFSGNTKGNITGALGVVNNFGTAAKFNDLNELANRQINCLINNGGKIKLWGGFSSSTDNNQRKFISVVRGIMYLKKTLKPILENYLEEPNDIPTWRLMYMQAKDFLDSMVTKRALASYKYYGDQNAPSLNDLEINNKADVLIGKYKIKLLVSFIPGMQEIEVNLILDNGTLSFELIDSLTN